MSVGRICVRNVDLADGTETIWLAAERMHQRAVGALVVLNDAQQPIGILSDRDIVERVVAVSRDPSTTTVADVMTGSPWTIPEDASIESAIGYMRAHGVRRLPVVDRNDRLVGLVTLDDIVILLAEELADIGRLIERQTPQAVAER